METISLHARYGYVHKLRKTDASNWKLELDPKSSGTYRVIGFDGESKIGRFCFAIDPDGGPFLSVGDKIGNKTIKSITTNGILELE